MTTPKKAHTSRRSQEPYRWLGAGAVALGLGVAMTTGHGIALAEPTSDGGTAGATAGPAGDPAPSKKTKKPTANTNDSPEPSATGPKADTDEHLGAPTSTHKKRGAKAAERVKVSAHVDAEESDDQVPAPGARKTTAVTPPQAADSQAGTKPAVLTLTVQDKNEKAAGSSTPALTPARARAAAASTELHEAPPAHIETDSPAPATPAPAPLESLLLFFRRVTSAAVGHHSAASLSSAPPDPVPVGSGGALQYRLDGQRTLQVSPTSGTLALAIVDGAGAAVATPVTIGGSVVGSVVFNSAKTRAYVTTNDVAFDRAQFGVLNLNTGAWVSDPVRVNGTTTGAVFTDKNSRVWLVTDDVAGGTPGTGSLRHRTLITLIDTTTGAVIATPIDKPDTQLVGGLNFYAKGRALITLINDQSARGGLSTTYVGVINTGTGALIGPLASTGGSELAAPITFDSKKTRAYITTNDMAFDRTQFGVLNLNTGTWVSDPIRVNGTTTGPIFTDKNTRVWLVTDDVAGGTPGMGGLRHRALVTLINTTTGAIISTPIDKPDTQILSAPHFYATGKVMFTLSVTMADHSTSTIFTAVNTSTGALI